ncbi:MAG: hypothetical protein Barrevirus17_4 [Barrevirus sp.]|uniref:Uncharacterized protein n=1 Tax=Barrevirus sp. TaxID=2487763 RepID=A0A3G4ZQK3_9VIRU|nr:MAG: hypothetical protein Barrevirus17_4 [Barrevirus sp.]
MENVSCFTIMRHMITRPRNENIFWIYFLKPVIFGVLALIGLCLAYLYCVPLTNIVGQGLFADFKCPPNTGVWGACGYTLIGGGFDISGDNIGVGFFVWLLIQSTVGLYIVSIILYFSSRRKGYVRKWTLDDCLGSYLCFNSPDLIDEWVSTNVNQKYNCCTYKCEAGPYLYYTFTICFTIATIMTTIIVGTWLGRYGAINGIEQCLPYKDTQIGLYGCFSSNNTYVGGQTCQNCAGFGFLIVGVPLLLVELFSICLFLCIKKCRVLYREFSIELERDENEKQIIKQKQIEIPDVLFVLDK